MKFRLNVVSVLDLAEEAVRLRGADHTQERCDYLSVTKTDDGLIYKAECFVGFILFLLVGPSVFIPALLRDNHTPYSNEDPLNGSCDTSAFRDIAERMGVTITPQAQRLLTLMQRAQDSTLATIGHEPWGRVLAYAKGAEAAFGLAAQEAEQERAEKAAAAEPAQAASHAERVQWVRTNPTVMRKIVDGSIIQAIKEVRASLNCGLKEAKDAVDEVRQPF